MKNRLLGAGGAVAALLALQPFRLFVVDGTSMTPTFASGQILLANARPHDIVRGDVVVFRHEGETMVKRVAYLPGDAIQRFWFVGEWKFPSTEKMRRSMDRQGAKARWDVIPQDSVYVLADNPDGSIDSRTLGPIPKEEVLAIVPNADSSAEWTLEGGKLGTAMVARL